LGEIAHFIYNAAPRQVEEVAIAGAIVYCQEFCADHIMFLVLD